MPAVPKTPEAPAEPQTPGARQVQRAKDLEKQRSDLMDEISANRTYLRLMATNGELSAEEKAFVDTFYPSKERGERRSAEQIAATRTARDEARGKKKASTDNGGNAS